MYSIQEAKETIKAGMKGYLQKNEDGSYCYKESARMPFYVEGKPGIGKTEIVRQVAEELGIGFVSFSITHHTRSTLLGLPVIVEKENYKYTEYTMSEIIAKVKLAEEAGYKEGILLLDEFNCASETIYPMMLALLQTRNIGYYRLPEGWNLVLLGNPKQYNKSAREQDAAILDRVRKIEVDASVKDFLDYAKGKNFHPAVQQYLASNSMNLYYSNQTVDTKELVTCRGWENLSHALYAYEKLKQDVDVKTVEQFIKSEEIAGSFAAYYSINKEGRFQRFAEEVFNRDKWAELAEDMKKEKIALLWKSVEQLTRQMEKNADKSKAAKISEQVSMVFEFLALLPDADNLREHFFSCINQSKVLCHALMKVKNKEYLSVCRSMFTLDFDEMKKIS